MILNEWEYNIDEKIKLIYNLNWIIYLYNCNVIPKNLNK